MPNHIMNQNQITCFDFFWDLRTVIDVGFTWNNKFMNIQKVLDPFNLMRIPTEIKSFDKFIQFPTSK